MIKIHSEVPCCCILGRSFSLRNSPGLSCDSKGESLFIALANMFQVLNRRPQVTLSTKHSSIWKELLLDKWRGKEISSQRFTAHTERLERHKQSGRGWSNTRTGQLRRNLYRCFQQQMSPTFPCVIHYRLNGAGLGWITNHQKLTVLQYGH